MDRNDLIAQLANVQNVLVGDFSSHRYFSGFLHLFFEVLGQDIGQIYRVEVFAHADQLDGLDECNVVGKNLTKFGEVPAVPEKLVFFFKIT